MSENKSSKKSTWEKLKSEVHQEPSEQVTTTEESANTLQKPASCSESVPFSGERLQQQLTDAKAQLEQQEAQLEQYKNSLVYQRAEMENLKRRSQRDIESAHKFSLEKFINELLPVKDNLERALGLTPTDANDPTLKGVKLTLHAFQKALENQGIKEIAPAIGDAFNPDYHQAMSIQETEIQKPDTILSNLQKGYLLHGRLIRPAAVIVAKAQIKNS